MKIVSNDGTKANIKVTEAEVQQMIYTYERWIKTLCEEKKQLEANWDELKGWLKTNDIHYAEAIPFRETLNKMQELERGKE